MSPESTNNRENENRPKQEIIEGIAAKLVSDEVTIDNNSATSLLADVHREHPEIEMRNYQIDCLDTLSMCRSIGEKRALIQMATGLGKTTVVAADARRYLKENPSARVLFLCHQNQILQQARERFEFVLGRDNYSYGNFTGVSKDTHRVTCLFASFQTMKGWRNQFDPKEFDYIVADESHHAKAETYEPTLRYFQPKFLLGMTATPDRRDLREIREIFGYEKYSINLAQALAKGLLAKPDYRVIIDDLQQDMLDGILEKEGVNLAEINRTVFIPKRDEEIANIVLEKTKDLTDSKAIVFCPSIEHSRRITELLPNAETFHSRMKRDDRFDALNAFKDGRINTLVTVDMFNEGMDIADANVIVFLRSTQSETIFLQQLGRGLRKLPGKDNVLVLDFVANCDRLLMIEKLLHDAVATSIAKEDKDRSLRASQELETGIDDNEDVDLYSIDFDVVLQDSREARDIGLGNFEFTETTRKILEIVRKIQTSSYEIPPKDTISIPAFAQVIGVAPHTVRKAVKLSNLALPKYRFGTLVTFGLNEAAQSQIYKFLAQNIETPEAPEGVKSLYAFAKEVDSSKAIIKRIAAREGIKPGTYTFGGQLALGLTLEQQEAIIDLPEVVMHPPEGYVSVNKYASKLGIAYQTLKNILDSKQIDLPAYKFGPKISGGISPELQQSILEFPEIVRLGTPQAPSDVKSIRAFAEELGVDKRTIHKIVNSYSVELPKFKFSNIVTFGLTIDIQERIRSDLRKRKRGDNR